MASEPQPVRLPNPSAQPFLVALKTTRFFAVLFFWVTLLALLAHLAAFVMTEWFGFYDVPEAEEPAPEAARMPAGESLWGFFESRASAAEMPPEEGESSPEGPLEEDGEEEEEEEVETSVPEPTALVGEAEKREMRREITARVLGPVRALGLLSGLLFWITTFVYLEIGLLGRLAGIRHVTRAFFLVLLYLATVIPWHNWFAELQFGSFYTFEAMWEDYQMRLSSGAEEIWPTLAYYGRYLVMPVLSLLLLVVSGIQFSRGYGASVLANE
jgi:hypothetical protein